MAPPPNLLHMPDQNPVSNVPDSSLHPEHAAVHAELAKAPGSLPNPEHHGLKQLPPPHIHWAKRIGLWGGAVIIIIVAVFAVGYMRFSWQQSALLLPAQVLPYPVAIVAGQWVSYADYQKDVPNISRYLERNSPPDAKANEPLPWDVRVRQLALNKMVGEALLAKLAKERNVTITETDVNQTFDAFVQQYSGTNNVEEDIQNLYGWTVAQFKEKVIRPQVYQQKLADSYIAEIRKEAEGVRAEVMADTKRFADIAKEKSDDVSATKGGQLEAIKTDALEEEYGTAAEAVGALKEGAISEVLETPRGFEILWLEKRTAGAKADDPATLMLRRILVTADVSAWLQDKVNTLAEEASVLLFEPRFRWEAKCGILEKDEPSCTEAATNTNTNQ